MGVFTTSNKARVSEVINCSNNNNIRISLTPYRVITSKTIKVRFLCYIGGA